jgi:elongation factor Tu
VRGQALAAPGTISAQSSFRAQIYVLRPSEGGRHTPFASGYRPQCYFGATNVSSVITLAVDGSLAAPGQTIEVLAQTDKPVPITVGAGFTFREGGRTVAAGTVLQLG